MIVTGCNEANIQWNVNSSIYMYVCILRYTAADEQKLSGMTKCSAEDLICVWVLYCKWVVVTLNNHQVVSIPFEKLFVPDIISPGIF